MQSSQGRPKHSVFAKDVIALKIAGKERILKQKRYRDNKQKKRIYLAKNRSLGKESQNNED